MHAVYVIIVKTGDKKEYLKVTNVDADYKYVVNLSDYTNASVFSGEQVEEIMPTLVKNNQDLYIYAEKIGELSTL
jgi:hypothetical protein